MESATSQYEVCFQKITVTPLCPSPETTAIGAPHPVIPLIQDISTSWFYRFLCIFPPPGYTAFYAFFLSAYFLLLAALDVLHCTVFLQLSILYSCLSFVHCRIQRYAAYQPQTGTRKIFLKLELDTEFCLNPWKGTPFQTRLSVLTGHFWFEFWINWAFQHIFHHFKTSEKKYQQFQGLAEYLQRNSLQVQWPGLSHTLPSRRKRIFWLFRCKIQCNCVVGLVLAKRQCTH